MDRRPDRHLPHRDPRPPLHALFHIYALLGLRRGEGIALYWDDIDLDEHTLTVRRQFQLREGAVRACPPKTWAALRTIYLDPNTTQILRTHRDQQQREQAAAGTAWTDGRLVFTTPTGQPLMPGHASSTFRRLVRDLDLPPVRLHDLRHGAASLALAAGADLKTVSELLGHRRTVTTADTYMSVLPELGRQCVEASARLLLDGAREISRTIRYQPQRD